MKLLFEEFYQMKRSEKDIEKWSRSERRRKSMNVVLLQGVSSMYIEIFVTFTYVRNGFGKDLVPYSISRVCVCGVSLCRIYVKPGEWNGCLKDDRYRLEGLEEKELLIRFYKRGMGCGQEIEVYLYDTFY